MINNQLSIEHLIEGLQNYAIEKNIDIKSIELNPEWWKLMIEQHNQDMKAMTCGMSSPIDAENVTEVIKNSPFGSIKVFTTKKKDHSWEKLHSGEWLKTEDIVTFENYGRGLHSIQSSIKQLTFKDYIIEYK